MARKPPLRQGDRIKLVDMPDDPCPVPIGTEGTVQSCEHVQIGRSSFWQVSVDWDGGRSLMLTVPPDRYERLP